MSESKMTFKGDVIFVKSCFILEKKKKGKNQMFTPLFIIVH